MPATDHHLDAVLLGGGIAGLWTLARLTAAGYRALLITDRALGSGQTIASQGIIHGGIKYTLGLAEPGEASRRIAAMPELWRACLEGRGEVDLGSVRVLSPHQYLWTTPGLVSRIAGLGASRVIRTAVERLGPGQRPPVFEGAPRGIDVYRVDEPVLAPDTIVRALAEPLLDRIVSLPPHQVRLEVDEEDGVRAVKLLDTPAEGSVLRFLPRRTLFLAGAGNASLFRAMIASTGAEPPVPMQTRPLHMVVARWPAGVDDQRVRLFGHCLGSSTVPRITVNTARAGDSGPNVWYIGGQVAESGVQRSEPEQRAAAARELAACVPWLDTSQLRWMCFRIDRAEGLPEHGARPGARPDGPVLRRHGRVLMGWPTKLAFAPALAADVLAALRKDRVEPGAEPAAALPDLSHLPRPAFAPYPWESAPGLIAEGVWT